MKKNNPFMKACTDYKEKPQGLKPEQWLTKSNNGDQENSQLNIENRHPPQLNPSPNTLIFPPKNQISERPKQELATSNQIFQLIQPRMVQQSEQNHKVQQNQQSNKAEQSQQSHKVQQNNPLTLPDKQFFNFNNTVNTVQLEKRQQPARQIPKIVLKFQLKKPITNQVLYQQKVITNQKIDYKTKIQEADFTSFYKQIQLKQKIIGECFKIFQKIDILTTNSSINRKQNLTLTQAQKNRFYSGFNFFSLNFTKITKEQQQRISQWIASDCKVLMRPLEKITQNSKTNVLSGLYILIHTLRQQNQLNFKQFFGLLDDGTCFQETEKKLSNLNLTNDYYLKKYLKFFLREKLEFLTWLRKNLQNNREQLETQLGKGRIEAMLLQTLKVENYDHYDLQPHSIQDNQSIQYLNETLKETVQALGFYFNYLTQSEQYASETQVFDQFQKSLLKIQDKFKQCPNIVCLKSIRNEIVLMQIPQLLRRFHQTNSCYNRLQFKVQGQWPLIFQFLTESLLHRMGSIQNNPVQRQSKLLETLKSTRFIPRINPQSLINYFEPKINNLRKVRMIRVQCPNKFKLQALEFLILVKLFEKFDMNKYATKRHRNEYQEQKLNQRKQSLQKEIQNNFHKLFQMAVSKNSLLSTVALLYYPHLQQRNQKIIKNEDSLSLLEVDDTHICAILNQVLDNDKDIFGSFADTRKNFVNQFFGQTDNIDKILEDEIYLNCFKDLQLKQIRTLNLIQIFNLERFFVVSLNRLLKKVEKNVRMLKKVQRIEKVVYIFKLLGTKKRRTAFQTLQVSYYYEDMVKDKFQIVKEDIKKQELNDQLLMNSFSSLFVEQFMSELLKKINVQLCFQQHQNFLDSQIMQLFRNAYNLVTDNSIELSIDQQDKFKQICCKQSILIRLITQSYNSKVLQHKLAKWTDNNQSTSQEQILPAFHDMTKIELNVLQALNLTSQPNKIQSKITFMRVVIANQAIQRIKQNQRFKELRNIMKDNNCVENIKVQDNCFKFINMLMEKVVFPSLSKCQFILHPETIFEEIKWLLTNLDQELFAPFGLHARVITDTVEIASPLKINQREIRSEMVASVINNKWFSGLEFVGWMIRVSKLIQTSTHPCMIKFASQFTDTFSPEGILFTIESTLLNRQFIESIKLPEYLNQMKPEMHKLINWMKNLEPQFVSWQTQLIRLISKYDFQNSGRDVRVKMQIFIKNNLCSKLVSYKKENPLIEVQEVSLLIDEGQNKFLIEGKQRQVLMREEFINTNPLVVCLSVSDLFYFLKRIRSHKPKSLLNNDSLNGSGYHYQKMKQLMKQKLQLSCYLSKVQQLKILIPWGKRMSKAKQAFDKLPLKSKKQNAFRLVNQIARFCQAFTHSYTQMCQIQFADKELQNDTKRYNKFFQIYGLLPLFQIDITAAVITALKSNPSLCSLEIFVNFIHLYFLILQRTQIISQPIKFKKREFKQARQLQIKNIKNATLQLIKQTNRKIKDQKLTNPEDKRKLFRAAFMMFPLIQTISDEIEAPDFIQIMNLVSQGNISQNVSLLFEHHSSTEVLQLYEMTKFPYEFYQKKYHKNLPSPTDLIINSFFKVLKEHSEQFFTGLINSYLPEINYINLKNIQTDECERQRKEKTEEKEEEKEKENKNRDQDIKPERSRLFGIYIRIYIRILQEVWNEKCIGMSEETIWLRFMELLNCIELVYGTLCKYLDPKIVPKELILKNMDCYKELHNQILNLQKSLLIASSRVKPSSTHKFKKTIYLDFLLYIAQILDNYGQNSQQISIQNHMNSYQKQLSQQTKKYQNDLHQTIVYCAFSKNLKSKKNNQYQFQLAWKLYIKAFQNFKIILSLILEQKLIRFIYLQGFLSSFAQFLEINNFKVPFQNNLYPMFKKMFQFLDQMKDLVQGNHFETIVMALLKIATLLAKISTQIINKTQINDFGVQQHKQKYLFRQNKMREFSHLVILGLLCSKPVIFLSNIINCRQEEILRKFEAKIIYREFLGLVRVAMDKSYITKNMLQSNFKDCKYSHAPVKSNQNVYEQLDLIKIIFCYALDPASKLISNGKTDFSKENELDKKNVQGFLKQCSLNLVESRPQYYGGIGRDKIKIHYLELMDRILDFCLSEEYLACLSLLKRVASQNKFKTVMNQVLPDSVTVPDALLIAKTFNDTYLEPVEHGNEKQTPKQYEERVSAQELITYQMLQRMRGFQYIHTDYKISLHPYLLKLEQLPDRGFFSEKVQQVIKQINFLEMLNQKSRYFGLLQQMCKQFSIKTIKSKYSIRR